MRPYLESHGGNVHALASRSVTRTAETAMRMRSCSVLTAQGVADHCDLIFVTTPDALIAPTVEGLSWRPGSSVVHCSGATEISVLGKAAADGADIGGFHPMQTFGDALTAARTLPGCVVTVEAGEALGARLADIAQLLGCEVNRIPAGARGRYHAAAAYASQYVNVLLDEAIRIWRSWGASEEAALRALLPLLRGTISAMESAGVAASMPGPVSRGDVATVMKQMLSVAALGDEDLAFYRTLYLRSIRIAEGAGRIDAAIANELRDLA